MARGGAAEGRWLRADRQTAGRGRLRREWVSEAGNLYASTLVRLRCDDPPAPSLALVAGIALHDTLSSFAAPLAIKWPNDLLAGHAKIGGILLERHAAATGDAVVVGIGANLAHHPVLAERAATSILALSGAAPGADVVCEALAEAFARALAVWRDHGLAATIADWGRRAHPVGSALALALPDGEAVTGLFDGLAADGALRLRLAAGGSRVIHAADVALIRD